ncbi:VIT1/CCC1 transporter family protein [Bradyrhizobium sp. McL0616]|uniref:VIT1/CCC1 transporter family protein n=1 Tax=Bradyrhizobium sp. McL0616 TaxID=3415674 RepID=UPI003CFBB76F
MSGVSDIPFARVLEPMERISETLFGLIMALTFICSLGVATAGNINIRTMLIGALGCNLAWGIVDGGLFLLARINDQGRKILTLHAIRLAPDPEAARRVIADALPPELVSVLPSEQLELMRRNLQQMPEPCRRPRLTKRDWIGALGLCLLSFFSTFPVVCPFIVLGDARLALRVSYAVAIGMLFCCGYVFGRHSGLRPWASGLSMVAVGGALIGVAVALGVTRLSQLAGRRDIHPQDLQPRSALLRHQSVERELFRLYRRPKRATGRPCRSRDQPGRPGLELVRCNDRRQGVDCVLAVWPRSRARLWLFGMLADLTHWRSSCHLPTAPNGI